MAGPAATVNLTANSQFCNDQTFRASENVAMDAFSGGQYIANETDISSAYIYYANYSFGQSVNQYYTRVLENNGVSVEGSTALPQGYSEDWPGQFQKAVDADVDTVLAGFTVTTLPDMVGTFVRNRDQYDFSFSGGYTSRVGAALIGATIVQTLDGGLTQESLDSLDFGPFTTRYHWNQYDNPVNEELVNIHTDKYGYYPDLFTSGMFTGASAIHEAATLAGSTNPQDIRNELSGLTVTDTPKGEDAYTFQGYNNQARSPMTVSDPMPTTQEAGEFWQFNGNPVPFMPGEPVQTFGKDETTLKSDDESMGCSL
jgi:branched-chain amino acid transport system substrate-binding protein